GTTIVVIGDNPLDGLPFGALAGESDRFLLEDHPIVMAPSLTFFLEASRRARAHAAAPGAALVFAPTPSGAAAPFPPLPDARAEAAEIARTYAASTLVGDADATSARFLSEAPRFDVIHFAGHGVANLRYPLLSRLLTHPGADDQEAWGALTAEEIGRHRFDGT